MIKDRLGGTIGLLYSACLSVRQAGFRVWTISPILIGVGLPHLCVDVSWDGGVSRIIFWSL